MSKHDHKHDEGASPRRRSFFDWGDDDDDIEGAYAPSSKAIRWWERAGGKDFDAGGSTKSPWTPRGGASGGSRGPLSSFWSDRFGGFRSASRDEILDLVRVMNGLSRVGRIIYQDDIRFVLSETAMGQSERGATNVRVDTAALKSNEVEWEVGERVDATMGSALAEAAVRKHAVEPAYSARLREAVVELARKHHGTLNLEYIEQIGHSLAHAANWLHATGKVIEEFPGYAGYFESDRSFHHNDARKQKAQADVDASLATQSPRSLVAASTSAVWNAVAPDRALVPDGIDGEVQAISQTLREKAVAAPSLRELDNAIIDALTSLCESFEPPPPCNQKQAAQQLGEMTSQLSLGNDNADKTPADESTAVEAESAALRDYHREDLEGNPHVKAACNYSGIPIDVFSLWQEPNARNYACVRARVFNLVQRVRASLSFRNEIARMDEQGLRTGLIDEGGLTKLAMGDVRIFRRQEVVSAPSVHIALLLDESGSMRYSGDKVAQECAVLLHEATRNLPGVAISIWGHTANDHFSPGGCTIYRYLERGAGDPDTLGSIVGRSNNLDGAAVAYAGKRMLDLARPGESRILFVLCDGQPAAHITERKGGTSGLAAGIRSGSRSSAWGRSEHYGNPGGIIHTRAAVDGVRKSGTQVFALGMGDGIRPSDLTQMYGESNWIHCERSDDLPRSLSRLLKRALKTGAV